MLLTKPSLRTSPRYKLACSQVFLAFFALTYKDSPIPWNETEEHVRGYQSSAFQKMRDEAEQ